MHQVVPYGSLVLGAIAAAVIAWIEGGGLVMSSLVVMPFLISGATLLGLEIASKRARAKRRARVIKRRTAEASSRPENVRGEPAQLDPGAPRVTDAIGLPLGIFTKGPLRDYRQDAS